MTRKTSVERHLLNEYEHAETNNTTTESNKDGFEEWWSIQKQLKKRIQKTCKKFGPSLRKNIKRNELMYDPRHELLFCRNAKVSVYSAIYNTQIHRNMSELSLCTNIEISMGLNIEWICFNILMGELKVKEDLILDNFTDLDMVNSAKLKCANHSAWSQL